MALQEMAVEVAAAVCWGGDFTAPPWICDDEGLQCPPQQDHQALPRVGSQFSLIPHTLLCLPLASHNRDPMPLGRRLQWLRSQSSQWHRGQVVAGQVGFQRRGCHCRQYDVPWSEGPASRLPPLHLLNPVPRLRRAFPDSPVRPLIMVETMLIPYSYTSC